MNLTLPLDFERLPEFWQLTEALRGAAEQARAKGVECQADVEQTALLLWVRLWVVLGYLARHTNRPGWLNAAGERQVNGAFAQFGEECPPVALLAAGGVLLAAEGGGWDCPVFAAGNRALAGNYVSAEKLGNLRSRISAARNNVAAEAVHQAELLPPETFRKRDGSLMDTRLVERSAMVIMMLDRCLNQNGFKSVPRPKGSYTPGLMADAAAAFESVSADQMQAFYEWLHFRREHPATPKTAEEVLREFPKYYKASTL